MRKLPFARRIDPHIRLLILAIAYGCIAILSWLPGDARPHTALPSGDLEHLLAYFVLGALTAGLIKNAANPYRLASFVAAYGGVMELGQLLVPGRNASFENFGASAVGAVAGVILVSYAARRWGDGLGYNRGSSRDGSRAVEP